MRITKLISCLAFLCNSTHCIPNKIRTYKIGVLRIEETEDEENPSLPFFKITAQYSAHISKMITSCRVARLPDDQMSALLAKFAATKQPSTSEHVEHILDMISGIDNPNFRFCFTWNSYNRSDLVDEQNRILSRIKTNPDGSLRIPSTITIEELRAYNLTPKTIRGVFAKIFCLARDIDWNEKSEEDSIYQDKLFDHNDKTVVAIDITEVELKKFENNTIADGILAKIADKMASHNLDISLTHIFWDFNDPADRKYIAKEPVASAPVNKTTEAKGSDHMQNFSKLFQLATSVIKEKIISTQYTGSAFNPVLLEPLLKE